MSRPAHFSRTIVLGYLKKRFQNFSPFLVLICSFISYPHHLSFCKISTSKQYHVAKASVSRWIIDPPLEITVPSKRTPWPDAPPELPSNEKISVNQEQTAKRSSKTRSPRSKRSSRSKRKHEAVLVETQVSTRHSEQN
ncbi:hypothetical protein POTOM_028187 [Populus tomentosa]|uniref:Uncharacterized protein n=1 Tax=Populus tomentosa TaxID=118781 RepID=A0A8X7Z9Y8_POPTO|nr:hypothetical protein POTOM_028187 [Populus tomentosa]